VKRPWRGVLRTVLLVVALAAAVRRPAAGETGSSFLDGTARVFVACDLAGGTSVLSYEIVTDDGAAWLLDLSPLQARQVHAGDRLRVTGRFRGDRFAVDEVLHLLQRSPLAVREELSSWTTGTRRVLAILIGFPEDTTTPYSQAQARSVLFNGTSSVKNLYAEMSYGQTSLEGDVTPWLTATVSKPTTCDTTTVANQATARAQAAGYNLANYDLLVYAQTSLPCGWSGLAYVGSSGAWINGNAFSTLVVGHELGHNFGVLHSHSLACSGSIFTPTCDTGGSRSEYGDRFDTMGNSRAGHFNAYQKNSLGWMPAGSVATLTAGSADWTLSAFEGMTGLRAVQIQTGASSRTFWVEWRQPTGFDAGFPASGTNGAQIRIGPSRVGGTDLLDANPGTSSFDDAALPVGHWFGDTASGLEIETVSLSSGSLRVHAKFGFTIPTADFTYAPAAPVAGHAVTFSDASTGFVNGWNWDFGDGGTSTLENPSHSFSLSGPTNVSLTASNPAGSSTEAVQTVMVSPNPAFRFYTLEPCRVADTRLPNGTYGGPALGARSSRSFPMTGQCGIPATARSVSLNVTVTGPTAAGSLTLLPAGTAQPPTSTLSFAASQTRANNVIMELGTGAGLTVYAGIASGKVHVILDVNGYFQ
jgi:PKD repeat protein